MSIFNSHSPWCKPEGAKKDEFQSQNNPFHASFSIKGFRDYKERLFLLALYEVNKILLLNTGIKDSNLKIVLIPVDKASTMFLHSASVVNDTIGLKIITGKHNGKGLRASVIRVKKKESKVQKTQELLGGVPLVMVEQHDFDLCKIQSSINYLIKKGVLPEGRNEKLGELLGFIMSEQSGRADMISAACASDPKRIAGAEDIFRRIGAEIRAISEIKESRARQALKVDSGMFVGSVAGSINLLPLSSSKLESAPIEPCHCPFLLNWAKEYVAKVLPKSSGVGILEQTSYDWVDDANNLLKMIYSKGGGADREKTISQFQDGFNAIKGKVRKIDWELEEAKIWISNDPSGWLSKLCKIMEKRQEILGKLNELDRLALSFHHEEPKRNHLRIILASMAANLCSLSQDEASMWKGLAKSKEGEALLRRLGGRPAFRQAKDFASKAESESKRVSELNQSAFNEDESYKARLRQKNTAVLNHMVALKKHSPALSARLLECLAAAKNHINYKQGEELRENPRDYFSRVPLALALMGEAKPLELGKRLAQYVEMNARMLDIIGENQPVASGVLKDLEPLLYVQTKGFDMENNPKAELSKPKGYHGEEIKVSYWFTVAQDDNGMWQDVLNLEFMNQHKAVVLYDRLPRDLEQIPQQNGGGNGVPSDIDIYGKKLALGEIVPGYQSGDSLGTLYKKLFQLTMSDSGRFESIRERVANADMETAHYLSTLTEQRNHSGVAILADGNISKNMPKKLSGSSENSFKAWLDSEYGDGVKAAQDDIDWYVRQKAALRVRESIEMHLPFYVQAYVDALLPKKK